MLGFCVPDQLRVEDPLDNAADALEVAVAEVALCGVVVLSGEVRSRDEVMGGEAPTVGVSGSG